MTGPGHDRRHRLDRLPARPRQRRRADRRREGHDDDLDLRPPHHPGRRVRAASCRSSRPTCRASTASTRQVFARPRRRSSAPRPAAAGARRRPPPPRRRRRDAPHAPPGDGAPDEELLQAVQAATSLLKAHRTHGHLAAQARPARLRARGRPRARPRAARPHAGAAWRRIPAKILRIDVAGRHARRRAAAPARDLLRHDRLRDRAHRLAPPARVAAREDRVRRVPHAADRRGEEGAAAPPDPGRRARALHAQGLPGPEAVLDRGPRHDGPDARRADPALGRRTARARS